MSAEDSTTKPASKPGAKTDAPETTPATPETPAETPEQQAARENEERKAAINAKSAQAAFAPVPQGDAAAEPEEKKD